MFFEKNETCEYIGTGRNFDLFHDESDDQIRISDNEKVCFCYTESSNAVCRGVELCVALKNIYALAVGLVRGLLEKSGEVENEAKMYNLAAAIFGQGLWEIAYMVEKMGGQLRSVYSLPGATTEL